MMDAASVNQYHIVYALLQAGADPTVKNNWGNTLTYFTQRGNRDPKHELYQWREKVKALLKERGMAVEVNSGNQ